MTKAEKVARKFYPHYTGENLDDVIKARKFFVKGYSQAEKDIKELVEEQLAILDKQTLLHPDDDVFWGQRNAYKQMKDKLNSL